VVSVYRLRTRPLRKHRLGSGSNPNPNEGRPSVSASPSEDQGGGQHRILIVEDNAADVYLIRAALDAASVQADLRVIKDGEVAIRFIDQTDSDNGAPCPDLVILDLNLPRMHGSEVLQHLRKSRRCFRAFVIAVSSSDSAQDRTEMLSLGANGYFHKPFAYAPFMQLGEIVKTMLGN
jgi:two-component system, chemotaxis family, response regulator Rcp1